MTTYPQNIIKNPHTYYRENGLAKHKMPLPPGFIEVDEVADIGAGIRPVQWRNFKRHVCVEPHPAYCDKLEAAGYETVCATAQEYLSTCKPIEAIYLLDVIEHMHKNDGWHVIGLALEKATKQIIIYTPKGFLPQDEDAWGLGGDHWQKHRSGWLPGEFEGWRIGFHGRGFWAVYDV
jgi:hypothetical protein